MLNTHTISTVNQKVLCLLAKFSDREFYERQIAREIGISYGAANRALNSLYNTDTIKRRQEGRMFFYSVDTSNASIIAWKILINIVLLEPLVEILKMKVNRIVLFGSCARGTDDSQSDIDLFITSSNKENVMEIIDGFAFPQGFERIHIRPVIKTPAELILYGNSNRVFLDEMEQGITLWERSMNGPGI
jgi:predicted nucleotidyltransferase